MGGVPPSWMKKRPLPDSFILQFPVPCSPANKEISQKCKILNTFDLQWVVQMAEPTSVYIWADQLEFGILLDRDGNRRTQL